MVDSEAFNAGDVEVMNGIFTPDGSSHAPSGKISQQGGPFVDLNDACPMCSHLSQRKIAIDFMLADDDLVAVRSLWSGLYSGDVRGTTVAEIPVSVVYFNIYRVKDGRIVENWFCRDGVDLASQLGFKLEPHS